MHVLSRRSGFTLVEMAISLTVFGILLTSVFSITVQTSSFLGENEVDTVLQSEGNRAIERLTDILRKTGRTTVGGVDYPRVTGSGSTLEFLVLTDLDGNGYAYQAATSDLEWDTKVYSVKADADGNMDIYVGGSKIYVLGRFVQNLNFQTLKENPALHLKEILVSYEVQRTTRTGVNLAYRFSSSIHMRN